MSDPRFSRLQTDPRFRRPKKKQQKVVIDERFKSVFDQLKGKKGKERAKPRVDKYGRKLSKTHEEDYLEKYYRLAPVEDENEAKVTEEITKPIDYARGEVLMASSDEEDDKSLRVHKDLEEAEKEDIGIANRTRRLAVVNVDWDHVRAEHLFKIFSSLVSLTAPRVPVSATLAGAKTGKSGVSPVARGAILSVKVYPSDFGKARMEREEKEGPPAEIFKKRRKESDEINEKTIYEFGDENEYDEEALRRYQLERLRYYYAIVECDTTEAASHIYNELEGTELERSANVFDLSFVPDDMTFNNDTRDEVTENVSTDYKPVDYVTDALRHSKVKLTWDEDDPERYQATRRQLTRQEIEEADFRAYIASSSSEDESGSDNEGAAKRSKNTSREKLRALLLGGNDDTMPEGWNDEGNGNDVDMEITFTPGLSERKEEEETTLDKYQRQVRDRRKKRKEEHKEKRASKEGRKHVKSKVKGDDFFDSSNDEDEDVRDDQGRNSDGKREKSGGQVEARKESTAKELSLIVASQVDNRHEPKHFNMKTVLKVEKHKGKKGKKSKEDAGENELQDDFTIDVKDDRFKALHEDHQFAIDPTNPQFKKTKAMKAFLEERQRRQKELRGEDVHAISQAKVDGGKDSGLKNLVESLKRKSQENHGKGKRRRT
ncbi:Pre-rRNA-processing protein ESF1 [Leucoagaricus sp. SymC.cos]|nr:Pre-rRNA-processing protein ESF1 [Leucoagaricus sp. SymC.cos]